jgi:hypothetical protein
MPLSLQDHQKLVLKNWRWHHGNFLEKLRHCPAFQQPWQLQLGDSYPGSHQNESSTDCMPGVHWFSGMCQAKDAKCTPPCLGSWEKETAVGSPWVHSLGPLEQQDSFREKKLEVCHQLHTTTEETGTATQRGVITALSQKLQDRGAQLGISLAPTIKRAALSHC